MRRVEQKGIDADDHFFRQIVVFGKNPGYRPQIIDRGFGKSRIIKRFRAEHSVIEGKNPAGTDHHHFFGLFQAVQTGQRPIPVIIIGFLQSGDIL